MFFKAFIKIDETHPQIDTLIIDPNTDIDNLYFLVEDGSIPDLSTQQLEDFLKTISELEEIDELEENVPETAKESISGGEKDLLEDGVNKKDLFNSKNIPNSPKQRPGY